MRRHVVAASLPQDQEVKSVTFAHVEDSKHGLDVGSPDAEIDEWQTYHAQNVKEASARLLGWMKPFSLVMCPIVAASQVLTNGFTLRYMILSMGPAVIYICSLQFTEMFLNSDSKAQTILTGCIVQVCFFTSMLFLAMWLGLNAPNALLQHRIFLTLACPVTASGPCWCHLPLRLYMMTIIPIWVSVWLLFHFSIGFWSLTCVFYAIFSGITSIYMMHLANNDRWRAFQAMCAQERERQLLVAMHAALRGMLSTLFDASCICRMDGTLIECTPELQQFVVGAEAIVGSNLCSFASSEAERCRLQEFLDTATNNVHRAATIQCSIATRHGPTEAVLYAIVLPGGGACWSKSVPYGDKGLNSKSKAFFIGLQAPSAASQDVPPNDDQQIWTNTSAVPLGEMRRRADGGKVLACDISSSCPASEVFTFSHTPDCSDGPSASENDSISFVSSSRPPSVPNILASRRQRTRRSCSAPPEVTSARPPSVSSTLASRRRARRRSCGVQAAPDVVHECIQTNDPSALPPLLPGGPGKPPRTQMAPPKPCLKPNKSVNQSSSSSGDPPSPGEGSSPSHRSHPSDRSLRSGSRSSNQSSSIQSSKSSFPSSIESSLLSSMPSEGSTLRPKGDEIIIGGVDSTDSTWMLDSAGAWQRGGNMQRISLRDFLSLPRDDRGVRLSFGSLAHRVKRDKCKVCVHMRKAHGTCRHGALCFYCHDKHELVRAPRRIFKSDQGFTAPGPKPKNPTG